MSSVQPVGQVGIAAVQQENYTEIHGVKVPMEYIDPISLTIMLDPVIVQPSGNSYDRLTMEQYKRTPGTLKDPIHKTDIQNLAIPNRSLKEAVYRFLKEHSGLKEIVEAEWKEQEQSLLATADKIISFTAREFCNLFADKDEMTFPEDKEIRIQGIDQLLAFKFKVASGVGDKDKSNYLIMKILSEALLLTGKSMRRLSHTEDLLIKPHIFKKRETSYISLISIGTISLYAERNRLDTTMGHLFEKMQRDQVCYVNIAPGQPIVFHKISRSILEWVFFDKDSWKVKFGELLTTFIPYGCSKVELCSDDLGVKVDFDDKELLLVSDNGIRIALG